MSWPMIITRTTQSKKESGKQHVQVCQEKQALSIAARPAALIVRDEPEINRTPKTSAVHENRCMCAVAVLRKDWES